jgi:hypothetical protein
MTLTTCVVSEDGAPCPQPPDLLKPIGLCKQHGAEVGAALLPKILKDALAYMAATSAAEADGWADEIALVGGAQALPLASVSGGPHRPIVYVVKNGDRVKIGTTQNLATRMRSLSLRPQAVLCALDGGRDLERAIHRRFYKDRVGSTEWFELGNDLELFIKTKAANVIEPNSEPASTRPKPTVGTAVSQPSFRFPDGTSVGRGQWPDLFRVFAGLEGGATKKGLAEACNISRDTAMRAIDEWMRHGVCDRRDGRSRRYYLPEETS